MAENGLFTAVPVEYAVAVDRYLDAMHLRSASRRVYRIALVTWAWALVGRPVPAGAARRGAVPPAWPLRLLDDPVAPGRMRSALAERNALVGPATAERELSIVRGAIAWWRSQGWVLADPLAGLRPAPSTGVPSPPLSDEQVAAVFALPVALREQVCWRLIRESGAPVERVLALNTDDIDVPAGRSKGRHPVIWGVATARLLPLHLLGRVGGPLFLTERRAPYGVPRLDRCPITGRSRLSYRRAAELFTAATGPLDPDGRGWTLRRLRPRAPD
jgi:integrase/recombinase XerD